MLLEDGLKMKKFRTGNIVKIGNSIVIIDKYRTIKTMKEKYEVVDWISFTSSNVSGCTRLKPYISDDMCWECNTNDSDYNDYECEFCKGTGYYKSENDGMSKAVILADNAKYYIMECLTKNFDF